MKPIYINIIEKLKIQIRKYNKMMSILKLKTLKICQKQCITPFGPLKEDELDDA